MISPQEFKWLSTPFTEEEAKAVKKAFEQVSLRKSLFMEDELKCAKEKSFGLWKREKGGIMKNNDEFMEYIKRNPSTEKDYFRRLVLTQCLDEYIKELEDRRNFYKACSEEFNHLEERIKWLVKIRDIVQEEMWDTIVYSVTSENKQENQKE